jgi:cobalt-zinc-cadmium efflux system outer membrane protein
MIVRRAHVFVAFVLGGVPAAAQVAMPAVASSMASQYIDPIGGVSLDDAITRAIAQEPSLLAARAAVDVARGSRLQAGLRPNPTLSFERREEPGGTDNQTMVGVQWPLDLFRRPGRLAVAKRELETTEIRLRDRERLLAADVRVAYGEVLGAIRDLSTLDALAEAITRQEELLRARVEQGATPPLERDLLTVELRRLDAERVLASGEVEAAMFGLKRAIGVAPDTPLKVRDTLEGVLQRLSTDVSGREATAIISQRADVRAAEAQLRVAEARIDRAQREGRFDVSLTGNYMRMDGGFPQLGFGTSGALERVRGGFQYFTGGLMVMMPLFNRNQGGIVAARAERTGATAEAEAARIAAANELAAAQARDASARRAVQLFSDGALTLARQNLAVVSETFTLGRVTVFDVLAEQRRYLELERAYTAALRAAYDASTALRLARGEVQ